ncbi:MULTISPECIES: DUF1107 domain-containing protein [Oceanimonas]|uniref:DUF1107 domain-containing protein n=1 Tax=Oceanimonas smirnovii TaxID=264574 RepID=A0ABW7P372_9GAMM|nr:MULTISPECIES: DUF1107 domain-containing protein [Oceanimonas]MDV2858484.1 DUF1107 domain-containing protein [Oceanimonas sp. CAM02]
MRIFNNYQPLLIAKHVKTFFKGRLYIHGRGAYHYAKGLLIMPEQADVQHRKTVSEINRLINQLNSSQATA